MWKLKSAREQTLSYVGKGKGESLLSFFRTPPLPQQEVHRVEKEIVTLRFWNDQGYHKYLRWAWEFWRPDMKRAKWSFRVLKKIIWPPPYWKARRPWGRGCLKLIHWFCTAHLWHPLLHVTRWRHEKKKSEVPLLKWSWLKRNAIRIFASGCFWPRWDSVCWECV